MSTFGGFTLLLHVSTTLKHSLSVTTSIFFPYSDYIVHLQKEFQHQELTRL